MTDPMRREDLDALMCRDCGKKPDEHEPLVLHGRCHPESPSWPYYKAGVITHFCAKCGRAVGSVLVAQRTS